MTSIKKMTINTLSVELQNLKEQLKDVIILKQKVEELEKTVENLKSDKRLDLGNIKKAYRNITKCENCDKSTDFAKNLLKHELKYKACDKTCKISIKRLKVTNAKNVTKSLF